MIMNWILKKLSEPSTWAGLCSFLGLAIFQQYPELTQKGTEVVAGLASLYLIYVKEKGAQPKIIPMDSNATTPAKDTD